MANFEQKTGRPMSPESKELEEMEYLGRVFLTFDGGLEIKWLEEKIPKLELGDILVLKLRDIKILKIIIGSFRDLANPVEYEWLSKEIYPEKGGDLILKVYRLKQEKRN